MAATEETTRVRVIDTVAVVARLLREADERLNQVLIFPDSQIGSKERRELEEVARDLRATLQYLSL